MSEILPDCELKLYRVTGPGLDATFQCDGRRIWHEQDPLHELHAKTVEEARRIIETKGWRAVLVRKGYEVGLIQHPSSFEVRHGDAQAFFYFDENATRRAISGRVDKATAFGRAQGYLTEVKP